MSALIIRTRLLLLQVAESKTTLRARIPNFKIKYYIYLLAAQRQAARFLCEILFHFYRQKSDIQLFRFFTGQRAKHSQHTGLQDPVPPLYPELFVLAFMVSNLQVLNR